MKKKRRKIKLNKIRVILLVLLLMMIFVIGSSVKEIIVLQMENTKLVEEKKKLKKEKKKLEETLKEINDDEYIEEQARKQLKLIKPGEHLYIVDDKKKK